MKSVACVLLFVVVGAYGQIVDLKSSRTTHQQIVLSYSAPAGVSCRIEVSDRSDFFRVVHDVNPELFPGSDRDLERPGTWSDSEHRVVVIGKRAAELGQNGKRYSRSLQAATRHYIRLSECGNETVIEETTQTVPFGPMLETPSPAKEPGAEGMYAFPSWNWFGDRNTETVIDYLTGVEVRKLQLPADWKGSAANVPLGTPVSDAWTNPGGATGPGVAAYSGSDGATLFIPSTGWSSPTYIPSQLNIRLKAQVTGNATGEDAEAEVCLGNEVGCWTDWKRVDLNGKTLDDTTEVGPGSEPSLFWSRKGEWMIEGFHIRGMNRGIHIRKRSNHTEHTLEIDSVTTSGRVSELGHPSTSYPKICSDGLAEHNGKQFVLCFFYPRASAPRIHAINIDTGDSYYIGPAFFRRGVNGTVEPNGNMAPGIWDRENPLYFYTHARPGRIYRCEIAADALEQDFTGHVDQQPSSITCKLLTAPGYLFHEQVAAFAHLGWTPYWTTFAANRWALEHMQNGKLIFSVRAVQDMGGWVAVFDPTAAPPPGCDSCVGRVSALSPFGGAAVPKERKFCPLHSTNSVSDELGDWVAQGTARQVKAQNAYYWGGPWHIQVKRATPPGQPECDTAAEDCSIPPGHTTFQIMPRGPTGTYDFFDAAPGGPDDAIVPLEPGDLLLYTTASILQKIAVTEEYFEVVEVDRVRHTVTVRRGTDIFQSPWVQGSGYENPAQAQFRNQPVHLPAGAELYGICRNTAINYDGKGVWMWNFSADPYGMTYVAPGNVGTGVFPPAPGTYTAASGYASPNMMVFNNFGDHGTHSSLIRVQHSYLGCPKHYTTHLNVCLTAQTEPKSVEQVNAPIDLSVNINPAWAGQPPPVRLDYDTHIKVTARRAGEDGVRLSAFDVRPLVSNAQQQGPAEPGTMQVYKLSGPRLRRKIFPTVAASAPYVLRDISGPADCSADPENAHCIDDRDMYTYCVALHAQECRPDSSPGDVFVNTATTTSSVCRFTGSSHDTRNSSVCVHDAMVNTLGIIQTPLTENDPVGIRTRMLALHGIRPWNQLPLMTAEALTNGKWAFYVGDVHGIQTWNLIKVPPLPGSASLSAMSFERVPVEVAHPDAASFRVEFGYTEYGDPQSHYCTSRQESCVADKETFQEANPFQWASEPLDSVPCHDGNCRLEIPRIPGRVVFAEAKFFNESGELIESRRLPPL
jgi:hypothetical protein